MNKTIESKREKKRQYQYNKYHTLSGEAKQSYLDNNNQGRYLRKEKARKLISEWKSQGCRACGEKHECCISAHHINSSEKEYPVAKMVAVGYSMEKISKELAKCIPVCENCHRKIHEGVIPCP